MSAGRRPTVVVIGGGAAGTLTALHLARAAARRSTSLQIVLVDPAERPAAGVAFGTTDERHVLNVPAAGMSALPEDPRHFVVWRERNGLGVGDYEFAPRREWARYLGECLGEALRGSFGEVTLRHLRRAARDVTGTGTEVRVELDDATVVAGDAAVVATGLPAAGSSWAPDSLRASAFFVPDPWAPGALDVVRRDHAGPADVLAVGAGLTMVDVALSLAGSRPGRVVRAISRNGRLPARHADRPVLADIPDISDWGSDLPTIRRDVAAHVERVVAATGDWRPAVDGTRFRVAELWARLSESDRLTFLARDAAEWNLARHRIPPASAARIDEFRAAGWLTVEAATVVGADPLSTGGLRVELSDGTHHDVGWVVNCTGPQLDVTTLGNPVLDALVRAGAEPATAGMGFRTEAGRILTGGEPRLPIWTLGALRRGELWESTAIPEIRVQARAVAISLLDTIAPLPRRLSDGRVVPGTHPIRRPRDLLGLPISATPEAAVAYNAGLGRVMRVQSGAADLFREAAELDPGFALAHVTLALLGNEAGAAANVTASLERARAAVRERGDDRERSLVEVVGRRVQDPRGAGQSALLAHIAEHPTDVIAVSAAVPTIAFSGVVDVREDVWDLVERIGPAYGDHWWHASLLAFTRQDQSRFDEAGALAEQALSAEPSSGHAVHAQTHVLYETGRHETGRAWLDHWLAGSGRSANVAAHFSWHAALHDLALGDTESLRHRYYAQLADVTGVRRLIDTASLLWRWRVAIAEWDGLEQSTHFAVPPADHVVGQIERQLVDEPTTPFTAFHAAIAIAAVGDRPRLAGLAGRCRASGEAATREVVATVAHGLLALLEHDAARAARQLERVLPTLHLVGGSAAQRDVVEETLLLALVRAGELERARAVLTARLDRRAFPLDAWRRDALSA